MTEELFTELLAKKLSGEITPDELAEFNRLIAGNASYQKEFESIKSYWTQDDEPYENIVSIFEDIKQRAGIVDVAEEKTNIIAIQKPKKTWVLLRSVAAAAIVIIAASAYFYFFKSANDTQVQTKWGAIAKIKLPDGTLVTLNSLSVLKYPKNFTGKNREVYLSGEAYFDVTKDHTHPFIVHTAKSNIQVLGTAFDVKSYDNDPQFEATLFRGSIEATLKNDPAVKVLLKPSDKLIIKNQRFYLEKETYAGNTGTTNVETAWMNNELIFKNEAFDLLANSLARKYGVSIIFKNEGLKSIKFSGEFEKENINQILLSMQVVTKFSYKVSGNNIYIF